MQNMKIMKIADRIMIGSEEAIKKLSTEKGAAASPFSINTLATLDKDDMRAEIFNEYPELITKLVYEHVTGWDAPKKLPRHRIPLDGRVSPYACVQVGFNEALIDITNKYETIKDSMDFDNRVKFLEFYKDVKKKGLDLQVDDQSFYDAESDEIKLDENC